MVARSSGGREAGGTPSLESELTPSSWSVGSSSAAAHRESVARILSQPIRWEHVDPEPDTDLPGDYGITDEELEFWGYGPPRTRDRASEEASEDRAVRQWGRLLRKYWGTKKLQWYFHATGQALQYNVTKEAKTRLSRVYKIKKD